MTTRPPNRKACLVRMHAGCRSSRRRAGGGAQAGFTLVEVLVSLALLALIMALVPSGLQLGRRAWDSAQRMQRQSAQTVVAAFLDARISQAMALNRRDASGAAVLAFKGEPDALMFVAPSRDGPVGPGLFIFDLRLREAEGKQSLWMTWTPYRPAAQGEAQAVEGERALLRDVLNFELRYFGRRATGLRDWGPVWAGADNLPELVEITLRSAAGGGVPQAPITIEILSRAVP